MRIGKISDKAGKQIVSDRFFPFGIDNRGDAIAIACLVHHGLMECPAPVIDSLWPNNTEQGITQSISIRPPNPLPPHVGFLGGVSQMYWNGGPRDTIYRNSNLEYEATSEDVADPGEVEITVINTGPDRLKSDLAIFSIWPSTPEVILYHKYHLGNLIDHSAYGNDGSLAYPGASLSNAQFVTKGISLNPHQESTDYIYVPACASLDSVQHSMGLLFWVNVGTQRNMSSYPITQIWSRGSDGNGSGRPRFESRWQSEINYRLTWGQNPSSYMGLAKSQWKCGCVIKSGNHVYYYVNGVLVGTDGPAGSESFEDLSGHPLLWGCSSYAMESSQVIAEVWTGILGEFKIIRGIVTEEMVTQYFTDTRSIFGV